MIAATIPAGKIFAPGGSTFRLTPDLNRVSDQLCREYVN
jgi:hypothetical protein